MSVEQDPGFWKWVAGSLITLAGTVWGGFKYVDARFDRKADKHTVNNQINDLKNADTKCLGHIEKLFENAEADRKLTRDLHDAALKEVRDNQAKLIDILARRQR